MGIWRLVLTVFLAVGWVGSVQASTAELKTGAARTYQVPLYDGTGSAADQDRYGRYTIAEILGLVEANDVDGLTDFITNTAAVAAAMKDAPAVISALDTYFGSANWRADVVAAVAANTAKVSYPGDELSADQQAAIDNANTPSATNPFATQNDVVSGGGAVDSVFGRTGAVVANANDYGGIYAPALGTDDNYVTDAEKLVIGNTSGTNTGDQDLSGYLLSADLTYSLVVGKWTSCTSGYLKFDGTCDTPTGNGDQFTPEASSLAGFDSSGNPVTFNAGDSLPFAIGFTAPDGTGNLAVTDDTLDELAVAVDGLATGGTDDQTAAEVPITDSGGYFTGTDVEAALQEIGAAGTGGDNLGTATATDVSALFSGTGDYLKSDGTKGTPAGGTLTITEQSSDPSFSEMSTGDLIVSTASGDLFYKSATGGYTLTGAYTPDPVTYTLTVTDPGNNDAITCSDPDLSQAINCGNGGTDCTANVADGASITGLTATAATGRQFDNWTGDVTGSENPTTTALTISANKAVQGVFSAAAATCSTGAVDSYNDHILATGSAIQFLATATRGQSFQVSSPSYVYSLTIDAHYDSGSPTTMTCRIGPSADLSSTYYGEKTVAYSRTNLEFVFQDTTNQLATGTTYYWGCQVDTGYVDVEYDSTLSTGQYYYSSSADWNMTSTVSDRDFSYQIRVCQ